MNNISPKSLTLLVLLLLLINTALVVFLVVGKKERRPGTSGREDNLEMLAKELKLSPAQKEQHKQMRDEHFSKIKPYYDSLRTAKTALFNKLSEATVSDSVFAVYDGKVAVWQSTINRMTFEHLKKVRESLKPDQQSGFDQFMQKMMQRSRRDTSRKNSHQ